MPIHKFKTWPEYQVECDICHDVENDDFVPAKDQRQYTKWLYRWGWRKRGKLWLCPRCVLSRGEERGGGADKLCGGVK